MPLLPATAQPPDQPATPWSSRTPLITVTPNSGVGEEARPDDFDAAGNGAAVSPAANNRPVIEALTEAYAVQRDLKREIDTVRNEKTTEIDNLRRGFAAKIADLKRELEQCQKRESAVRAVFVKNLELEKKLGEERRALEEERAKLQAERSRFENEQAKPKVESPAPQLGNEQAKLQAERTSLENEQVKPQVESVAPHLRNFAASQAGRSRLETDHGKPKGESISVSNDAKPKVESTDLSNEQSKIKFEMPRWSNEHAKPKFDSPNVGDEHAKSIVKIPGLGSEHVKTKFENTGLGNEQTNPNLKFSRWSNEHAKPKFESPRSGNDAKPQAEIPGLGNEGAKPKTQSSHPDNKLAKSKIKGLLMGNEQVAPKVESPRSGNAQHTKFNFEGLGLGNRQGTPKFRGLRMSNGYDTPKFEGGIRLANANITPHSAGPRLGIKQVKFEDDPFVASAPQTEKIRKDRRIRVSAYPNVLQKFAVKNPSKFDEWKFDISADAMNSDDIIKLRLQDYYKGWLDCTKAATAEEMDKLAGFGGADYLFKLPYWADYSDPASPYNAGYNAAAQFVWSALCKAHGKPEWDTRLDDYDWDIADIANWLPHGNVKPRGFWDGFQAGQQHVQEAFREDLFGRKK